MKFNILILFAIVISIPSCTSTSEEEIFADVINYNLAVLNIKVTDCQIIDREASCAGKTESYIITCKGSTAWFKWDKSSTSTHVYALRANATSYRCNPELNYRREFNAHEKSGSHWVPEKYYED